MGAGKGSLGILAWVLVLAAVAGLFLANLGGMALSDRDEGEYAAAVGEMLRSHDLMVPTLNGRHYLEKPILVFWAVAAGRALGLEGELAARLPSALAAMLLALFLSWLAWRVWRKPSWAALAAAAFAFTPLAALVGRACLTDMLLALFTTLSLGFFFLATEAETLFERRWYLAAWAALGLGFLTKGPVALAVVLPTAGIYALWQRRLWEILKRAQIHWGLLIFLLINGPWFGWVFYRLGGEFWRAFFVSQNLRRFSEVLLGHGGGFFYYLPVIVFGAFPFFFPALVELGAALARNPRQARQADPGARLALLSALAVLVVLVVFSLAATKQINYILPALPFLALLAGRFLGRLLEGEAPGRLAGAVCKWGLVISAGLLALALAAVPAGLPVFWDRVLASIRPDSSEYALPLKAPLLLWWPLAGMALAAALGALAWWAWRAGKRGLLAWGVSACAALFCAVLMLGLLPSASRVIQEPAKQMAGELRQRAGDQSLVVSFGLWKPSLLYYLDREIPRVRSDQADRLAAELKRPEPVFVLSRVRLLPELEQVPGFGEIARYGGYLLGGNPAARQRWQAAAPAAPAPAEQPESAPAPPAPPAGQGSNSS